MAKTALDINIIDTHNIRTIAIADISVYANGIIISNPVIEITPPGFTKIATIFSPKSVNIYNSNNVGITTICEGSTLSALPDGIWQIKYSIQPALDTYIEKSFMRTSNIKCMYSKALLGIDMSNCIGCSSDLVKKKKEELKEIRLLIDGSIASANECDNENAMLKYRKAMDKLKRIKQCECK